MIIERTKDEVIFKLPATTNVDDLQDMADFLEFSEISKKSKARQSDVNDLVKSIKKGRWTKTKAELREMLVNSKFGNASSKVVIEEFLPGIELSVFVLTDGKSYVILPEAKDYKRIGEGDSGLNTGGMGECPCWMATTPSPEK